MVQLYRSLHESGAPGDSAGLISDLEAAIIETQKVLRSAVLRQDGSSSRTNGAEDGPGSISSAESDRPMSNVDSARQRLDELLSKEASSTVGGGSVAMSLIEQYSDILLNMMQSKMVSQYSNSPHSLPPTSRDS
ncbi:hypothetical protein EVAR_78919_1 [Eumeta japonica]|uniref:Uncharacterized protein n=1 Tax=Eumeta variegata TaxID=151549 RepID=A0A4C1U2R1_EUMVA|nr:hypothetical protein EVAR_78919_1 [Eumeta japonica]